MTKRTLGAVLLAMLAGCGTAQASHPRLVLHYTPTQPLCAASELGEHATVIGDGPRSFGVVCRHDGTIDAWDAVTEGARK